MTITKIINNLCILKVPLTDKKLPLQLTRTIKVSCSAQFLQTTAFNTAFTTLLNPDSHLCTQSISCTGIVTRLRQSFYRDAAPMHFSKLFSGDNNSTRYKGSTAIAPASDKTCTMTAKTAPYPSRHRDSFPAKVPGQVPGWLRRVTQPPFIAGPLGKILMLTALSITFKA